MPDAAKRPLPLALLALLAAGGCVTTTLEEPPPDARPVELRTLVIPFGADAGNSSQPVDQYYGSVLAQMQEALGERDLARLRALLVQARPEDAPEWARVRIERFATAALGLEFEAHAAAHSRIDVLSGGGVLGEPVELAFRLDTPADRRVVLEDTRDAGLRFLATLTVVDHDALGGRTSSTASRILRLREPLTRHMPQPSEATFTAAGDPSAAVVRELRTTVELLPGTVEIDDQLAPIQRMRLAERTDVLYPAGFEVIRDKPLPTLRGAIALGDPGHYPHQYLAARFMPESDRAEAIELLIGNVRLGDSGQARVAMASLAVLTGEPIPVGDRDAWLSWWQSR